MFNFKISTNGRAIVSRNDGSWKTVRVIIILVLTLCVQVQLIYAQTTNQPTCGKRLVNSVFLVHGGIESKQGRWPWHAAIYHKVQNTRKYECGGNIIGRDTILTVAHCFYSKVRRLNENDIVVEVGRVDLNKMSENLQVFAVSKVLMHPEFDTSNGAAHDIAVVKLASDIRMTPSVQPVCLWSMEDDHSKIIGQTGTVIGYGRSDNDQLTGALREAMLTVVDGYTCLEADRGTYGGLLTRNMFCAGGRQGANACNGDSGGGIFFDIEGTWYVRGIVSFTAKRPNTDLCDPSKYTVFTFVSKYVNWIMETIDTSTRQADLDGNFLLISRGSDIIRVPLNGEEGSIIGLANRLSGFDHDCVAGRFYWSNKNAGQINSATYDGTDRIPFIVEDMIWPEGIAVDWNSRRLYWVDSGKSTIEVAALDNSHERTILISGELTQPREIAVDPNLGKLYWLDLNDNEPKIEWSNLDGTQRQLLLIRPQINDVTGIQVLMATGELCFTNRGASNIKCFHPYSNQIRTIASDLINPGGLAITDEFFYWTDQTTNTIESISINGVRQKPISLPVSTQVYAQRMSVITRKCPLTYSPCPINNGGCEENTICLPNQRASSGKSCLVKTTCDRLENCYAATGSYLVGTQLSQPLTIPR